MSHTPGLDQQIHEMRTEHREDMRELRDSVKVIAHAVSRLAVLEEKHARTQSSVERLGQQNEKTNERMHSIELEHAKFISTAKGATSTAKLIWSIVGGGVLLVVGKLITLALEHAT